MDMFTYHIHTFGYVVDVFGYFRFEYVPLAIVRFIGHIIHDGFSVFLQFRHAFAFFVQEGNELFHAVFRLKLLDILECFLNFVIF